MIMLFVSPNSEEMGQHSCDAAHRFFFSCSVTTQTIILQLKYESIYFFSTLSERCLAANKLTKDEAYSCASCFDDLRHQCSSGSQWERILKGRVQEWRQCWLFTKSCNSAPSPPHARLAHAVFF